MCSYHNRKKVTGSLGPSGRLAPILSTRAAPPVTGVPCPESGRKQRHCSARSRRVKWATQVPWGGEMGHRSLLGARKWVGPSALTVIESLPSRNQRIPQPLASSELFDCKLRIDGSPVVVTRFMRSWPGILLKKISTRGGLLQLQPAPTRSYLRRASISGRRLSTAGIITSRDRTMREPGTNKPVGCLATTHRDAERCVSASATRPSSHRFGHGLQTRPSAASVGFPVLDRRRVTLRPTIGRAAGSGDPRRTKRPSGGVWRPSPNEASCFPSCS